MRILVAGAGPAGLMFARTVGEEHDVTILESAGEDDRPGQGITLFRPVAEALQLDSVELPTISLHFAGAMLSRMELPPRSGVGRRALIGDLRDACVARGTRFEFAVDPNAAVERAVDYDLLVGADGVGSRVRDRIATSIGFSLTPHRTRYAWLSARVSVPGIRLVCRRTELGGFLMWLYPFSEDESTIIVQCTEATLDALATEHPANAQYGYLSNVFREELGGSAIFAGAGQRWASFRRVETRACVEGNVVLLGDAWHTFHFSMGLGTVVALEDAVELSQALDDHDDVAAALAAYQEARLPVVEHVRATTNDTMGILDSCLDALDAGDDARAEQQLRAYGTYVRLPEIG